MIFVIAIPITFFPDLVNISKNAILYYIMYIIPSLGVGIIFMSKPKNFKDSVLFCLYGN